MVERAQLIRFDVADGFDPSYLRWVDEVLDIDAPESLACDVERALAQLKHSQGRTQDPEFIECPE